MGIYDEVFFLKYCPKCKIKTVWECQFHWEHESMTSFEIGEEMWKKKHYWISQNEPTSFNVNFQKALKHAYCNADGYAWCMTCSKLFNDAYWLKKIEHKNRDNCRGITKFLNNETTVMSCKVHRHSRKGMSCKEKHKLWETVRLPIKKWNVSYIGVCNCEKLERSMKNSIWKYWNYDCTVKIRNGVIKSVCDFKKASLHNVYG